MIVPSLRTCLAGLPTHEATAEVGQLLWCRRVHADGKRQRLLGTDTVVLDTDGLGRYL